MQGTKYSLLYHRDGCQVRPLNGMTPEELKRQGWEKRFTASEPRLSEAVELYESMDFEVLVLPATPEDMNEAGCDACVDPNTLKTIYTRPCPDPPDSSQL